jgi:hypothetical protein
MIKELISGLITCSSYSETHGIAQSYLRYRDTMTAIAMFISPRLLDLVMKQISLRHQPHLVRLRFNQRPLLKAGAGGNWIAMSPPHFRSCHTLGHLIIVLPRNGHVTFRARRDFLSLPWSLFQKHHRPSRFDMPQNTAQSDRGAVDIIGRRSFVEAGCVLAFSKKTKKANASEIDWDWLGSNVSLWGRGWVKWSTSRLWRMTSI